MPQDIIKHLKTYMRENRISQKQLADSLGISEAAVSRYLAYQRIPSKNIQKKLKIILGISIISISDKDITSTKNQIERLVKENIKHYSPQERLHLIHIIASYN